MAGHIRTLTIDKFRGIKNLTLDNLAPINILTGDNNCGKTSVLEVIETLENPGDQRNWRALINRGRLPFFSLFEGYLNLFNVDEAERNIYYTARLEDNAVAEVRVKGTIEEQTLTRSEYEKAQGLVIGTDSDNRDDDALIDVQALNLQISLNGSEVLKFTCSDAWRGATHYKINDESRLLKVIYISPMRHAEGRVFLNSVLDQPELYEQMLQILREYDPGIVSINVDNSDEKYARGNVYKILSKEHSKALPLDVYGDGMKKAVLLMSAVIKAQGGILLLDEFETAIHTSAMNTTFRWILENCLKLDVQLFLTSHSEEAIDKVLRCSPGMQDQIKIYTLYKNPDETVVRELNAEKAMQIKEQMGMELR